MVRRDPTLYKNISVHKDVHKQIASYGSKHETFDDILRKILAAYKEYKKDMKKIPYTEKPIKKVK